LQPLDPSLSNYARSTITTLPLH